MNSAAYKQHTGLLSPWVDGMRIRKVASHVPSKAAVLDIGCGAGLLIPKLPADCRYVGVDQDPNVVDENKRRFPALEFYRFDVCEGGFPFKNQEFDAVVMAAFLEHIDQPTILMKEIARVLKPSGRVIMTTPSGVGGRVHAVMAACGLLSKHAAEEHKDFFGLAQVKEIVGVSGLAVERYVPFQMGLNQLFILKKS